MRKLIVITSKHNNTYIYIIVTGLLTCKMLILIFVSFMVAKIALKLTFNPLYSLVYDIGMQNTCIHCTSVFHLLLEGTIYMLLTLVRMKYEMKLNCQHL